MDNPRPEKVARVAEVKQKLESSAGVVLTEYRGLNVNDLADLRASLAQAGGEYKVYKNTMVRFAADELNLEIGELLVGPTAIAFSTEGGDAATISKALVEFGKGNENLVVKGGILDGEVIDAETVTKLSKIAPREELLAKFAGGLAAPMQKMAALLKALPNNFAYALSALIAEGGAPADAPAAAEDAPAAEEAAADDAPAAEEAAAEEPAAEADASAEKTTETEPAEAPDQPSAEAEKEEE